MSGRVGASGSNKSSDGARTEPTGSRSITTGGITDGTATGGATGTSARSGTGCWSDSPASVSHCDLSAGIACGFRHALHTLDWPARRSCAEIVAAQWGQRYRIIVNSGRRDRRKARGVAVQVGTILAYAPARSLTTRTEI